jgi:MFS transporter, MHS family, proline/betaine transporter
MLMALRYLSHQQKEAIGLLQIGTFLEYFDLMLYVHMAVLLNELFFPKTDPHTAALLSAFAFCSTWVLRPFGALIFGYIGDKIGRKPTIVITTIMMAMSCMVMANLPTYEQIGITAAWIVTLCRVIQGLSSMGEIVGANIYLTEITKPPLRYMVVALTDTASSLGGMVALLVATLATSIQFNWRIAFWIGSAIALAGTIARTKLRETPDFIIFKNSKSKKNQARIKILEEENGFGFQSEAAPKMLVCYFMMSCASPLCFFITYFYCPTVLKNIFGYSTEQCIQQSFIISIFAMLSLTIAAFCSFKIHPLSILKFKFWVFFPFMFALPYLLTKSAYAVCAVQFMTIVFALAITPAYPILYKYIPVLKRFTNASMIYAVSRAATYIITSFGVVYITNIFSHYGLWIVMIPISIGFYYGVRYFEKLERGV